MNSYLFSFGVGGRVVGLEGGVVRSTRVDRGLSRRQPRFRPRLLGCTAAVGIATVGFTAAVGTATVGCTSAVRIATVGCTAAVGTATVGCTAAVWTATVGCTAAVGTATVGCTAAGGTATVGCTAAVGTATVSCTAAGQDRGCFGYLSVIWEGKTCRFMDHESNEALFCDVTGCRAQYGESGRCRGSWWTSFMRTDVCGRC